MEATTINVLNQTYISSEVRFYTIADVIAMTGWSEATVQKLFNDPTFPYSDFGKAKVIEAHALIEYFSKRRVKENERYWKKKGNNNGRKTNKR